MRLGLVRAALALVGRGHDPARAAQWALDELERRTGATAGLILLDAAGRVGLAHTSEAMAAAWRSDDIATTVTLP